jgi:hypothetical protein
VSSFYLRLLYLPSSSTSNLPPPSTQPPNTHHNLPFAHAAVKLRRAKYFTDCVALHDPSVWTTPHSPPILLALLSVRNFCSTSPTSLRSPIQFLDITPQCPLVSERVVQVADPSSLPQENVRTRMWNQQTTPGNHFQGRRTHGDRRVLLWMSRSLQKYAYPYYYTDTMVIAN